VEHGHALADVLLGAGAPSGMLPASFPRVTGQVPIYYNHKNTGRPPVPDVKWNSKYIDAPFTPLFPFGYGLSYTTFEYSNLHVSRSTLRGSESLTVTVDLKNTGSRAGTEVAQLYLRDDAATVTRPVRELRGFRRVALEPGQTRTLTFRLRPDDMAMYDRDMRRVVEPGGFTVWVGGDSNARLEGHFAVTGGGTVLAPARPRFR
jgi:beta-glucosidase